MYHFGIETRLSVLETGKLQVPFNCTILELKRLGEFSSSVEEGVTFNCTILELKHARIIADALKNIQLLIVPFWN